MINPKYNKLNVMDNIHYDAWNVVYHNVRTMIWINIYESLYDVVYNNIRRSIIR